MIFNNKQGTEAEKITIKVNNQDLLCEKNKSTRYYPSGAIEEIKVCDKEVEQRYQNYKTTQYIPQQITFVINGERQILELTGYINLYENGNVKHCNFTAKTDRIIVNIAGKRQSIKINEETESNKETGGYCYFHSNGNLSKTGLQNKAQQLTLEIGDIKQTLDVKWGINLYDNGKLKECYIDKPTNIECYINGQRSVIKLDNAIAKKTGFFEKVCDCISFFSDGALKEAKICEDINLNVKFHGKDYNLPFKNGDAIIFNDNKELSQECIDNSPERSAIVYAERLKAVEVKTEKLEKKQTIIIWSDIVLTFLWFLLSLVFLCWGFSKLSGIDFGGGEFICDDYNKYTFLYEILKRMPAVILFVVAFKFLQLAFERLRLIGEVEKVEKYLNLARGDNVDNVKNNLLSTIAIPFFAPKKVKSSFFDRLIDKFPINVPINIGSEQGSGGVINKDKQNHG